MQRRADASKAAPTDGELRTIAGRRALVVDDNATNRMILRQQLLSWGVEPVEAVDAFDAIAVAAAAVTEGQPFDLGVLDLNMPGGGGFSAANRIRNAGLTPKILIYTTHTFPGLERIARAADCDGFVVKANATQDLIRGIRAVLRGEEFYSSLNAKAQNA